MKKVISSYTFKIGTLPGCYPAGNKLVSPLFAFGTVSSILYNNTPNNTDYSQDQPNETLDLTGIGGVSSGTLTVYFNNSITIIV